jgi:multidrug efflux pump subunit AcrA (membrane-fusion protein)
LKKIVVFGLLMLILVALVRYYALDELSNKGQEIPPCRAVAIRRGDISLQVSGRGKTRPRRIVYVKTKIAGKIKEIMVKEGEQVAEGESLVEIETEPRFAFDLAEIRLRVRNARLKKKASEKNLARQRKLYEEGFVALMKVEKAEVAYSIAVAELNMALERLKVFEQETGQKLSDRRDGNSPGELIHAYVTAPISGTVIKINRRPGEIITPGISSQPDLEDQSILILADLSKSLVECKLSEIDIDKIRVGQAAEVQLESFPEMVYHGRIQKVSSIATTREMAGVPGRVGPRERAIGLERAGLSHFDVEIVLKNADPKLRIGMSCRVSILIKKKKGVLLAPVEAVAKEDGEEFVYVMEPQPFHRQRVTTGMSNESFIEITSGLTEGALLCDRPLALLEWEELRQMKEERSFIEKILKSKIVFRD